MKHLRCWLLACLALIGGLASAHAAVGVTQFTLQNGLKIVVIPDHRAPVVTHMLWFRVGAVDDPPGLSGLAHFFEHLMFKGTKTTPAGELSKLVARNGGQDNAFTTHDYTAFFERIAKDRLGLMMSLEADRMVNLDLSEENVTTEREVVREERHYRVDSDPSAQVDEQMEAALFLSHPYGRPVIGWDEEIQHIGRPEAIDYYQHHYAPNNATLIVVGDVTPEEVRKLAEDTYGKVPARTLSPRNRAVQPPRLSETRMDVTLPDARLPNLTRIYRVPSYVTGKPGVAESLDMLAAVLGGGPTSRLYKVLVVDRKLAVSAAAYYNGTARSAGEFGISAVPREGVSFDRLEAAIDEIVAGMKTAPPAGDEFDNAKTRLVASYIYEQDSQYLLANDFGVALSIGLSVEDVEDWPNRIKKVPAADVRAAAENFLLKNEAVTARLSPKAP